MQIRNEFETTNLLIILTIFYGPSASPCPQRLQMFQLFLEIQEIPKQKQLPRFKL